MKQYRSSLLGSVHETAEGLHDAGVMDKTTMRQFDTMCLTPVRPTRSGHPRECTMTHTFPFDTDSEARAFIEGVQYLNDSGLVERLELAQRPDGKWLVTVHRTNDPQFS